MTSLKVAVAQFEPKDGDKSHNLNKMEALVCKAANQGAELVSFHEMCITAYTFTKDLSRQQMMDLAEEVPDGESTQALMKMSEKYGLSIMAGLVEKEGNTLYNTYIGVSGQKMLVKYRKLHPFISPHLSEGNSYEVFEYKGWKFGVLICYDNNVIENVRATTLLGAEAIIAPHVTGCTPSAMPGRGYVADALWQNRETDPVSLRMEFEGAKGRGWLMRWLPARAYDNGVYYLFTNPIGYDGEHLKNGNSMVLDPYGEVQVEVRSFDDDVALATLTKAKIESSGGWRYRKARRPELYRDIIGRENQSDTTPVWLK